MMTSLTMKLKKLGLLFLINMVGITVFAASPVAQKHFRQMINVAIKPTDNSNTVSFYAGFGSEVKAGPFNNKPQVLTLTVGHGPIPFIFTIYAYNPQIEGGGYTITADKSCQQIFNFPASSTATCNPGGSVPNGTPCIYNQTFIATSAPIETYTIDVTEIGNPNDQSGYTSLTNCTHTSN